MTWPTRLSANPKGICATIVRPVLTHNIGTDENVLRQVLLRGLRKDNPAYRGAQTGTASETRGDRYGTSEAAWPVRLSSRTGGQKIAAAVVPFGEIEKLPAHAPRTGQAR